ncbi:hypothetical protein Tco_0250825, partial [Tanacetum coccineum]
MPLGVATSSYCEGMVVASSMVPPQNAGLDSLWLGAKEDSDAGEIRAD